MNINEAALKLIMQFEGLRLKAYKDPVGVWTIGYGHTSAAGDPKVYEGMTITAKQAEEMLRKDIKSYEAVVKKLVNVDLTENQFGALVSFVYNLGGGNFEASTLLKKINQKDWVGAVAEFAKWNKAGKRVLKGLTLRRAAEAALFATPVIIETVRDILDDPDGKIEKDRKPGIISSVLTFILNIFKRS